MPVNPAPAGDDVSYWDEFEIRNDYLGPQVGVTAGGEYLRWFWQVSGKLGLGWLHAQGSASGSTRISGVLLPGGVLAADAGDQDADTLALVPEMSLAVGYQLAAWCRLHAGYDFLFVSRMARVGSLISPVTSSRVPLLASYSSLAPPGDRNGLRFDRFWVQGFSAGLEIRW